MRPTRCPAETDRRGATRVVHRTEITGSAADTLGPEITADFPEIVAGSIKHAGQN
ncbi:hypothetical protein [Nocardia aurantiaca]|uniref:hypothetical protein n=1 Tax=Nocardia aurantiaca TaxID=2675850 RepID=UPI001E37B695|nr:hypothetical protein [Nocardia aurantiaca]